VKRERFFNVRLNETPGVLDIDTMRFVPMDNDWEAIFWALRLDDDPESPHIHFSCWLTLEPRRGGTDGVLARSKKS